jgi:hypothetical protein
MAVADLLTMLISPFHVRVRHMLHQCGKIAVALRPNDEMPVVRQHTISTQPHPTGAQRLLDDSLEAAKNFMSWRENGSPITVAGPCPRVSKKGQRARLKTAFAILGPPQAPTHRHISPSHPRGFATNPAAVGKKLEIGPAILLHSLQQLDIRHLCDEIETKARYRYAPVPILSVLVPWWLSPAPVHWPLTTDHWPLIQCPQPPLPSH